MSHWSAAFVEFKTLQGAPTKSHLMFFTPSGKSLIRFFHGVPGSVALFQLLISLFSHFHLVVDCITFLPRQIYLFFFYGVPGSVALFQHLISLFSPLSCSLHGVFTQAVRGVPGIIFSILS